MTLANLERLYQHYKSTGQDDRANELLPRIKKKGGSVEEEVKEQPSGKKSKR